MKKLYLIITLLFSLNYFSQGDCPGEVICTNQTDICVNGSISELNASNRGCLTSNEANRSYWYQFCIATSGSIQFTINPNGANNDFDWAIWGPNSACPPTNTPLRCSYAIVSGSSDNTGVNSINNAPQTDLTEGASGNQWTQDIAALTGQCYVVCINNYGSGSNTFQFLFGGTATILCSVLPIELVSWDAEFKNNVNILSWNTISERNNDKFILETSIDGYNWLIVSEIKSQNNTDILKKYQYLDYNYHKNIINYYRLTQIDYDNNYKTFKILSVNNLINQNKKIVYYSNLLGQKIDKNYEGFYIEYYQDGTHQKKCCLIQ